VSSGLAWNAFYGLLWQDGGFETSSEGWLELF